jgi:hypothetical protein
MKPDIQYKVCCSRELLIQQVKDPNPNPTYFNQLKFPLAAAYCRIRTPYSSLNFELR